MAGQLSDSPPRRVSPSPDDPDAWDRGSYFKGPPAKRMRSTAAYYLMGGCCTTCGDPAPTCVPSLPSFSPPCVFVLRKQRARAMGRLALERLCLLVPSTFISALLISNPCFRIFLFFLLHSTTHAAARCSSTSRWFAPIFLTHLLSIVALRYDSRTSAIRAASYVAVLWSS